MFVDRNGHPTNEAWTYCAVCRFHHYEVATYRDWLMKYGKTGSSKKSKEQIERWREIVERHGTRVDKAELKLYDTGG